jgi:hypothetical protein
VLKTSVLVACSLGLLLTACTEQEKAQNAAQEHARNRPVYVMHNDVEGKNYNARQKLADDPTSLIWCTAFPANPNAKPITVPVVGKLTSGSKTPFDMQPGPDGMYGESVPYRYGFTPAGVYVDFTGLETYCTSEPTLYQQQHTIIDSSAGADAAAEGKLRKCQEKTQDPSAPCDVR